MNSSKIVCNAYILFWLLYIIQGPFENLSGTTAQLLLVVNLIISIYYAIYANVKYSLPVYFKGLNILILLFTVYGVYLMMSPNTISIYGDASRVVDNSYYLKDILKSFLPIYPFYVFSKQKVLTEKTIRMWFLILIPFVVILYFYHQQQALLKAIIVGSDREEFTNNTGYLFLAFMPLTVFFRKRPLVQFVLIAICMFFIIIAMKRGAIIISTLCFVVLILKSPKISNNKGKGQMIVLSIIILIAGFFIVQYMLTSSDYFNYRLEQTLEGESSGRDVYYTKLYDYFLNETDLLHFLFGSGANATILLIGDYAHNDWLEIATNQGLLGLLVYLYYWICFYKTWKLTRYNQTISLVMLLIIMFYFLRTFFSMSYADIVFYSTMALGYCLGNINLNFSTKRSV